MSTRSSKLSELPIANSVGANDTFYIVQSGNSYQIAASSLGLPPTLEYTVGPVEGNTVIASSNTNQVPWLGVSNSLYSGVKIFVDAVEGNNRTQGLVLASFDGLQNTFNLSSNLDTVLGNNQIQFSLANNVAGNGIIYFTRQSNSQANVSFRWQVTYFIK